MTPYKLIGMTKFCQSLDLCVTIQNILYHQKKFYLCFLKCNILLLPLSLESYTVNLSFYETLT
jgi:hypothetical protein